MKCEWAWFEGEAVAAWPRMDKRLKPCWHQAVHTYMQTNTHICESHADYIRNVAKRPEWVT